MIRCHWVPAHDSTSLYLHFRALGRPFLWAAYFRPSVHTGANECGSFSPFLFRLSLHRSCSIWETESNIEWLDLVSTPAAADWDASFTVERINLQQNIAKAFRRKCEFDQMREVPFVRMPDQFAFARSHLAPILLSFLLRFFSLPRVARVTSNAP